MKEAKYKIGEKLEVKSGLSYDSEMLDGKVIQITRAIWHEYQQNWFYLAEESSEGIWEDELYRVTKLHKALR